MFFILSKIIWFLLAPLNLLTILTVTGLFFLRFKKIRAATALFVTAMTLFLLIGVFPTGQNAVHYLESRYSKPTLMPPHIDGILILGGAVESDASELSGMPEFNDAVDRVNAAIILSRKYPAARIVFSGGSGKLIRSERIDSIDMKMFLKDIAFDASKVIYEDRSRTTSENLINSKEMLKPKPHETWILVTSAWHTPRAMGVAQKLGWGLIPYPVDYRASGRYLWVTQKFDVLDNIYMAHLALREISGIAAYRINGKI
ncbi:MAG: putative rane protein [Micavibrio sp.]|nr:putative rane protein [Micavibrio sp.]